MSLIEKYNISEVDLEQLFEIETKKTTSGFMEKEKLKAASLKILKPYKVKFIDLGNLLSEIKNGGVVSKVTENIPRTDKVIQEKSTSKSSSKSTGGGKMTKILSFGAILLVFLFFFKGCGQSDESLKSELEGKAFGNWKTVTVQFQMGGRYEAYLKASEAAWDKHSMGEGTWEVKDGNITLSPNDSQSETVRKVQGVYTYDGESIESATHQLHD